MSDYAEITVADHEGDMRFVLSDQEPYWRSDDPDTEDLALALGAKFPLRSSSPSNGTPGVMQARLAARWLAEKAGLDVKEVKTLPPEDTPGRVY